MKPNQIKYLCIIQARLGSTRFPNKVMQTVGGIPMVRRVWLAAINCKSIDKVIVAWPERYPDLDENDVRERYKRIINEFGPKYVIRLTSDCPLLATEDINDAICEFSNQASSYYSNRTDGHDVQIFTADIFKAYPSFTHKEHVIDDIPSIGGCSVNTKEDLEKVRRYAR